MKRILLSLFVLILLSLSAFADAVWMNGIYYNLNSETKEAEVTNNPNKYTGSIIIPKTLVYEDVLYNVTSIGGQAFRYCSDLTSIEIPNSITSIGDYAFSGCTGLTSVEIPNSVISIGLQAFYGCTGLTSMEIPSSVISIGRLAFAACTGLTSIVVSNDNPIYDSRDNCNAIVETASNTLIAGCQNTIIPNNVKTIAHSAFYDCTGLSSVTIPNSVKKIGDNAFAYCTGLTYIEIPYSVINIGNAVLSNCTGVNSIVVSNDNPIYDSRNNCNAIIETASNTLILGCKNTIIPNDVTCIGAYAFNGCTGLTSIEIPHAVTKISTCAFYGCKNLTLVNIPNNVATIGSYAFYYCYSLSSVISEIEEPYTFGDKAFNNISSKCTLMVPQGTKNAYIEKGWTEDVFKGGVYGVDDIIFKDANVKAICIANWDTNSDGELSISEAASVTSLNKFFKNKKDIVSFNELKYFTGLTTIGDYTFDGCSSLQTIIIPSKVASISSLAFGGCTSLTSVVSEIEDPFILESGVFSDIMSESFLFVPKGARNAYIAKGWTEDIFKGGVIEKGNSIIEFKDKNVKTVCVANWDIDGDGELSIPEAQVVTNLNDVFNNNNIIVSFDELQFFTGLNSIGPSAFFNCKGLTSIEIPNNVKEISQYAFRGCTNLTSIRIPANLTSIGHWAFAECTNISSMSVDEGNTVFDSRNECNAIINTSQNELILGCKSTVIPPTVKSIASYAFKGSGITDVTIPNNIESIGLWDVFGGCKELKSVTVRQATPLTITDGIFSENTYQNAVLYVPSGRKTYFEGTTGWGNFRNIQEFDMPDVVVSTSPFDNVSKNQMILGYYRTHKFSPKGGIGGGVAGKYKACIGFDKLKIRPFVGNKITHVRFALLNTDISDVKLWISSARDAIPVYTQNISSLTTGWNEVKLDNAFEILNDSIYIGIEYKQQKANYPLSRVMDGHETGSFYINGPYSSDGDYLWVEDNSSLCVQCLIEGDKIPEYDIRMTGMSVYNRKFKQGGEVSGYIDFRSWGKKDPRNFDAVFLLNGKQICNKKYDVIPNINSTTCSCSYSFSLPIVPIGIYNLDFVVMAINKETPQFTENDTLYKKIGIIDTDMGRQKVLLELHTGTWCPYTPSTHKRIEQMMTDRDDIVLLSIHHSDEFSTDASDVYSVFSNVTPATYYNRHASYGATGLESIDIDCAKQEPSMAKLQVSGEYVEDQNEVRITVKGEKNEDFDSVEGNVNLTVLLTEDGIKGPQKDADAGKYIYDYVHNGVIRTNASAIWGDPVTWNGNEFEMKYTVKLEEDWVKDNMNAVAFLAKPFTGNNYDEIELVNCNDFALKDATITTEVVELNKQKPTVFDVYSLSGIKLRSNVTSLDELPVGLYVVNGEKVFVGK